jgi:hypothetical protein
MCLAHTKGGQIGVATCMEGWVSRLRQRGEAAWAKWSGSLCMMHMHGRESKETSVESRAAETYSIANKQPRKMRQSGQRQSGQSAAALAAVMRARPYLEGEFQPECVMRAS